jgi:hypothetical protein
MKGFDGLLFTATIFLFYIIKEDKDNIDKVIPTVEELLSEMEEDDEDMNNLLDSLLDNEDDADVTPLPLTLLFLISSVFFLCSMPPLLFPTRCCCVWAWHLRLEWA